MAVWLRHKPGWHAGPAGRLEVGRMQRGRPTRHENEQTIYGRSRDRRRRKISHELAQQQGGQKGKSNTFVFIATILVDHGHIWRKKIYY
ncbi:hypothetical protein TNCT_402381 [Trichonephila clavata]|uniref:Uncharacterized protein n=1 Tax=Trichonephila clavata TaxID=2740835 RepID=A0A8X6KL43_TRICU|nr:hypothetical protein TNCT_402381 [Trichonephila clavata]